MFCICGWNINPRGKTLVPWRSNICSWRSAAGMSFHHSFSSSNSKIWFTDIPSCGIVNWYSCSSIFEGSNKHRWRVALLASSADDEVCVVGPGSVQVVIIASRISYSICRPLSRSRWRWRALLTSALWSSGSADDACVLVCGCEFGSSSSSLLRFIAVSTCTGSIPAFACRLCKCSWHGSSTILCQNFC